MKDINIFELVKSYIVNQGKIKCWSPLYGTCYLSIYSNKLRITPIDNSERIMYLDNYGRVHQAGEIMVYPSCEQRDWGKADLSPKVFDKLNNVVKGNYMVEVDMNNSITTRSGFTDIEHSCLAALKIYLLLENSYGGIFTLHDWNDSTIEKYIITPGLEIRCIYNTSYPTILAFHSKEQAKEFLSYNANITLIKDYYNYK